MGDRRSADAALGADHRDDAAERFGPGNAEQVGDGLDEFDRGERRDEIFADAARHQLAVEDDVVDPAEHDDLGARVAEVRQLLELLDQQIAVGGRLEHDDVGRRRAAIGFDRRSGAAHVLLDVGLGHAPVGDRGLDDRRGLRRLAERLDRHARHRIDLRDGARPRRRIDRIGCLCAHDQSPVPTWPIGVILVFQLVPGSLPLRTSPIALQPHRDVAGARWRGSAARSRGSATWAASVACVAQPKLRSRNRSSSRRSSRPRRDRSAICRMAPATVAFRP